MYCPAVRPPALHSTGLGEMYTVGEMRRRVACAAADPGFRGAAERIAGGGAPASRARRIREWLGRTVLFQPDPPGWELLHHPRAMIEDAAAGGRVTGDCDDVATLGAALGAAVGLPARFVLLAFTGDGPWEHVYADLWTGARWAELDTTRPVQYAEFQPARWIELPA